MDVTQQRCADTDITTKQDWEDYFVSSKIRLVNHGRIMQFSFDQPLNLRVTHAQKYQKLTPG